VSVNGIMVGITEYGESGLDRPTTSIPRWNMNTVKTAGMALTDQQR